MNNRMILNVVIDANIGAGKTTLIGNLRKKLVSTDKIIFNFFEENVEEWINEGWLSKYYSNIPKYASSFQMRVLLSHIEQRKKIKELNKTQTTPIIVNICERCAMTTVYVFSKMLVNDGYLDQMEMDMHKRSLDVYEYEKPDILIYLDTSPESSYERLKNRSRNGETTISLDYLKKLHEIYCEEKHNIAKKVILLNGNENKDDVLRECEMQLSAI